MAKKKNPFVFLDVSIDGDPYERMIFELFIDAAPKIAENFRALCTVIAGKWEVIQLAVVGLFRVFTT